MSTPPNNSKPPGSGLDTGTGGFPIGPNNSRQSYDVGSDVGNEFPKPAWSPGEINVDKSVKDLSRGTKRTLASYLSDTTLGKTPSSPTSVKNRYPINHVDGSDPVKLTLNDEKGYPTRPDRDLSDYNYKFTEGKTIESRSKADTNLKIKRGRQDGNLPDGNDLLMGVSPVAPPASALGGKFNPPVKTVDIPQESPVKQYYGNPNLSNSVIYNRFNPENKEYKTQAGTLNAGQFAKKYEYGTSEANRDVSFGRLAQVGSVLSSRASIELNSTSEGYNPDDETLSAVLPGVGQLGVKKIDWSELEARSVIDSLTTEAVSDLSLVDIGSQSWGSLNNVNDAYGNISSAGMILLSVALVVALSVVLLAMTALLSFGSSGTYMTSTDIYGRRHYGASRLEFSDNKGFSLGKAVFSIWDTLGINHTEHPINKCIPTGAFTFFGMNTNTINSVGAAAYAAGNAGAAVAQSPGYYAVIGRLIARSFTQIADAFGGLGAAFSASPVLGALATLNIIGAIKNSKFVRFVNLFASIGDLVIKHNATGMGIEEGKYVRFPSEFDDLSLSDPHKGRLTRVDSSINPITLSWASYRSPDAFIVPFGLQKVAGSTAAKKMGVHTVYTNLPAGTFGDSSTAIQGSYRNGSPYYKSQNNDENRIPTDDREKLESLLDSEYVPFYLHDVRTNEIVSFHAFLASLSDDYTANYDTQEGFGRVEPVKIYKSTTRKIGFSFYVVSTGVRDFDAMWQKINKLTTLLYPQFSEGRMISTGAGDEKYQIYMPFSQTIQASPLVRLRIGDLIKTNYSKFNLARIFGYSYRDTVFAGKTLPAEEEKDGVFKKEQDKLTQLMERPGTTFTTEAKLSRPFTDSTSGAIDISRRAAPLEFSWRKGLVLRVVKNLDKDNVVCEVAIAEGRDREGLIWQFVKEELESEDVKNVLGKKYIIKKADLVNTVSTEEKMKDEAGGEYSNAVNQFMIDNDASKGNAIARSFRSAGGKGLAGFIDSMNFDWYDRVTWNTEEGGGRTAPKMCKVTISFSPIHDITPGLDHMGANRAPIYNIRKL